MYLGLMLCAYATAKRQALRQRFDRIMAPYLLIACDAGFGVNPWGAATRPIGTTAEISSAVFCQLFEQAP